MPGGWEGSTWEPPENWSALVAAVARRSGGLCEVIRKNGSVCGRPADGGVDHIVPVHKGGPDVLENLQHGCRWHHRSKTSKEGNAAKAERKEAGKIPLPRHPGMRRGRVR